MSLPRSDYVYEPFIDRWAARYLEIRDKHGQGAAMAWANSFLNPEDVEKIKHRIKEQLG